MSSVQTQMESTLGKFGRVLNSSGNACAKGAACMDLNVSCRL